MKFDIPSKSIIWCPIGENERGDQCVKTRKELYEICLNVDRDLKKLLEKYDLRICNTRGYVLNVHFSHFKVRDKNGDYEVVSISNSRTDSELTRLIPTMYEEEET